MAVRLHIQTAFIAKSRCASNAATDRQRAMEQEQLEQLRDQVRRLGAAPVV